jgi:hypothetical protein
VKREEWKVKRGEWKVKREEWKGERTVKRRKTRYGLHEIRAIIERSENYGR